MYNLTYKIKENGYEIYKDEVLWISQYEPYIPNPSISYEENAIKHIEELNTPSIPNVDIENKISILTEENEKLKQEQEQQNEEILVNMLANTEMFEIILGMIPMTLSIDEKNTKNSGGSSMIEVYVTLIIKGVKTIEDVPLVIREQVIERLKQLEVPVK